MRKLSLQVVIVAMLVLSLTVLASAQKTLTLYGSTQEMGVRHIVEAFERDTGVKVNWIRLSTGEALNRLRAEKNNPQASVWLLGPGTSHLVAKEEGLLEPYFSPMREFIDEQYMDPEGYWTGVFVTTFAFTSNPQILKEYGLEEPTSYYDILKPEWKNLYAVSNPATSGTAYLWLATMVQLLGEDEAFEYLKQFDDGCFQYSKSGMAPAQMAGRGEIAMGITMAPDSYYLIEEGYDLSLAYPKEGVGYSLEPVSLIKGGPEPEVAREFVDWLLSPAGQKAVYGIFKYPLIVGTNREAVPAEPEAEGVPLEVPFMEGFDLVWMAENYDRLIERFENEIMYR